MKAHLARLRRLLPYFRRGRGAWLVAFAASVLVSLTQPLLNGLIGHVVDHGFKGERDFPLWMVPAVVVGLFALRGVCTFITQYALNWAGQHGVMALREAVFARLFNAQPLLFARRSASSLTNTIVYEIQNGTQQLFSAGHTLLLDSLQLLALVAYLVYLNWQLTALVLLMFPAMAWAMTAASRRLRRLAQQSQTATDDLAYQVEENVLAWRIVRLHDAAAPQRRRFEAASRHLRGLTIKAVAAGAAVTPVTQLMASLAMSAVVVAALWQSQADRSTVGQFVAFISSMLMLITPIKHLADVAAPITRGLTALERALGLIEDAPLETSGRHQSERARGEVVLRGVSVRFASNGSDGGSDAPALADVDLTLHAGQTVALVGPSGAGKTTLVNLLPRFVEPTAGSVTLDGVPLPDWDIHALRSQFALVSQDVVLFNASVLHNVALQAAPDEARAEQALRDANLWEFVQGRPGGWHGGVGHNGSELSGGQRQRLAIARALYKDAPILILDEATSALDAHSERQVQQALERLMRGRTTVVIAHRLATIERADTIVVMEAGRVVEQGGHAELLAAGGLYARLVAMQWGQAVDA